MTRTIQQLPWTLVILTMAALCLFSATIAPSFAASTVPPGVLQ